MRKLMLSLLVLGTALLSLFAYLVWRPNVEQVKLDKKADVFLLTEKGISSLSIADNQLKELAFHETDLTSSAMSRGNLLDQRYYLFAEEPFKTFSSYQFSLDLKEAKLRREPIADFGGDNGLVIGEKATYRFSEDGIKAYSKDGLEVSHHHIVDDTVDVLTPVGAKSGLLYAQATTFSDETEKGSVPSSSLYIFQESDLRLIDTVLLTDEPVAFGNVLDSVLLGNALYYTVSDYRTENGTDYVETTSLVKLDLVTKIKQVITLEQSSPLHLYADEGGQRLFIEHDSYESNHLLVTDLSVETGEQNVLDLSQDLSELTEDYPSLTVLKSLGSDRVLLMTRGYFDMDDKYRVGYLYLYDLKEQRVLSQLPLDKDKNGIGILDNPYR